MKIIEETVVEIPDALAGIREENREAYTAITPRRQYRVQMPNKRWYAMVGAKVKQLPHWRHCIATHHGWHIPQRVMFALPTPDAQEGTFILASGEPEQQYERWKSVKAELASTKQLVQRYERKVVEYGDFLTTLRRGVIAEMKARKHHDVDERFTYENIKATLLQNEHIIDVRIPGEKAPDYRAFRTFACEPMHIYEGNILVTFTGAVIYDPHVGDGSVVGIPTPPISMLFSRNGTVMGYGVCAHPHMAHTGGCMGDAHDMLQAAISMGNIYAAVDVMQEYRIGHSSAERGRGQWEQKSWNFWCKNESHGWPEEEPFQKPWIAAGRPVYVGITGQTMPVYEWLNVADRDEAMQAFHLGLSTMWYNPAAMKEQLATAQVYTKDDDLPCLCGRPWRDDTNDDKSLCICHRNNPKICSGCASHNCRCVADLQSWTTAPGVTYCYAHRQYVSLPAEGEPPVQMYRLRNEIQQLLPSTPSACEPCLLERSMYVE